MTDTLINFDGGVPGNAVVAGANGIDTIMDGTPMYIGGLHGRTAVQNGGSANTADTRIRVDLGGIAGDHYGSVYIRQNTAHGSGSSSVNFFHLVSASNAFLAQFRSAPGNALSIRVNNVEVRAGAAGDLEVGSWMRLDWHLTGTTLEWKLFWDHNGTLPDRSGSVTTVNDPPDALILGAQSSAAIIKDWSFDTVRASDTASTWYAPYSSTPPPTGPTFKVWNGTSEVAVASVTIWNGTSEVPMASTSIA